MPNIITNVLTVVGRLAIVAIFFGSAVGEKIPNFSGVVGYMEKFKVPEPRVALVGAIVLLLAGSLSIALGYRARVGATMLLVFLIAATYYFHQFWTFSGQDQVLQKIQFMKNVSMAGTMIFLIANGSGPASLRKD